MLPLAQPGGMAFPPACCGPGAGRNGRRCWLGVPIRRGVPLALAVPVAVACADPSRSGGPRQRAAVEARGAVKRWGVEMEAAALGRSCRGCSQPFCGAWSCCDVGCLTLRALSSRRRGGPGSAAARGAVVSSGSGCPDGERASGRTTTVFSTCRTAARLLVMTIGRISGAGWPRVGVQRPLDDLGDLVRWRGEHVLVGGLAYSQM